jgi:hypothetical protein
MILGILDASPGLMVLYIVYNLLASQTFQAEFRNAAGEKKG